MPIILVDLRLLPVNVKKAQLIIKPGNRNKGGACRIINIMRMSF
jgi:hypothetical protein